MPGRAIVVRTRAGEKSARFRHATNAVWDRAIRARARGFHANSAVFDRPIKTRRGAFVYFWLINPRAALMIPSSAQPGFRREPITWKVRCGLAVLE